MPILKEHKDLLASQSASRTLLEWLDYFDNQYTRRQIDSFCYRNKYSFRKRTPEEFSAQQSANARKYNINADYFKTWSRNMAYIFGLWCADGCIYNGKMFDITLHKRDKYLLKRVAEELKYEGQLYDYVDRQASRINFSCVTIYKDLCALGGTEAKSLSLQFPNIPDEYLADFIRGYFDGDGCIMLLKNKRINSAFTCASKPFLEKLLQILQEKAKVQGGSFDDSCCSLKFGKRDTIKIGQFIYQNEPDIYLLRKKEKFDLILQEEI